jgi:hypothetical protein
MAGMTVIAARANRWKVRSIVILLSDVVTNYRCCHEIEPVPTLFEQIKVCISGLEGMATDEHG